jgi:hypothetical protein
MDFGSYKRESAPSADDQAFEAERELAGEAFERATKERCVPVIQEWVRACRRL